MPSHFEAIGWTVDDAQAFSDLAIRTANEGEVLLVEGSAAYVRWAPGAGVELWAQVIGSEVIGLNPHFSGDAAPMRIALASAVEVGGGSELDRRLHAWANPDPGTDDPESGDYPFLFDAPDPLLSVTCALPAHGEVRLVAFAELFETYADEEEFDRGQEEPRFATRSFIPTGMFGDGEPAAEALFHGFAVSGETRTNPVSGQPFTYVRVDTLGGEIDVVVPAALAPGSVAPGAIVRCGGWLSGQVSGLEPRSQPSTGRRWFRRGAG